MSTPPEPAMHLEKRWERTGNKKTIVEPKPKEREVRVRFEAPAIQRVKGATRQAERVERVTKSLHSSARIRNPKPSARPSFNEKTSIQTT